MSLESSKIKKEQFGLIWNLKPNSIKNKKQVPQFFPFLQKRQERLWISILKSLYIQRHILLSERTSFLEKQKNNINI